MNNIYRERIQALQALMLEHKMDAYVIPTGDDHQSEYVSAHFKFREYMSGFTGSAGTLVVLADQAGLWTDGRYFIQAEKQLAGSGIRLFRMADQGVPTVEAFLKEHVPEGGLIGFNGRTMGERVGEGIGKEACKARIEDAVDFAEVLWKDRPALPAEPVFRLSPEYAGESSPSKIRRMRKVMEEKRADLHVLCALDDIAWLFNIRGGDIRHTPVALSYAVLTGTEVLLFIQEAALTDAVRAELTQEGVQIRPYDAIFDYVRTVKPGQSVLLDPAYISYRLYHSFAEGVKLIESRNPEIDAKAVKNAAEIGNIRRGHILDGVAFTKFMYWLKTHIGKEEITECTAADYLEERRREIPGFLDLSFDTIAGYGPNAAMMHYKALPETAAKLGPEGMLLVDSGGQYMSGTTDITRTIVLGPLSGEQKRHFTAVLRSMLDLAGASFLEGSRGTTLDILAREPIWELNLDYKCGTGHGVGYLLSVHEGPQRLAWRQEENKPLNAVLKDGMVITDEPGIYLEGRYGIRTENELLIVRGEQNEYGQFLHFEHLTMAPIDLDGVDPEMMTPREIRALNAYHREVYENLKDYLTDEEREWLKEYTRAI